MKKILLVEDVPMVRCALAEILSHAGYEIIETGNVAEALAVPGADLDAVVSDYELPDGEGDQVIREMKRRAPSLKAILTSSLEYDASGNALCVIAAEAGADMFLLKPFSGPIIIAQLRGLGV